MNAGTSAAPVLCLVRSEEALMDDRDVLAMIGLTLALVMTLPISGLLLG